MNIAKIIRYFFHKQTVWGYQYRMTCFKYDLLSLFKKKEALRRTKGEFKEIETGFSRMQPNHIKGQDPTIDQYIKDHGGIKSPVDNRIYTTKSAYLDSIKRAGKHIHE